VKLHAYTLLIILGTCLVTQFEKGGPLWILGGRKLPPFVERWLGFVPAAVLTALLVPEVLLRKTPDETYALFLSPDNVYLLAAIPALAVAYWKDSFLGSALTGMAAVALLRFLF